MKNKRKNILRVLFFILIIIAIIAFCNQTSHITLTQFGATTSRQMMAYGIKTLNEKIYPGKFEKGDIVTVSFKQKLLLAPNKYTLSFSCTHINANGELEVLSRKYDALLIEVTSTRDCVGLYRLDSDIAIKKVENGGK